MDKKGILLIVSGPSGAGKGTICSLLLQKYSQIYYSVSMTTRTPRKGEVNGKDYHFVSKQEFEKLIAENAFLEYAQVYDNYYGTLRSHILGKINQGIDVLLEIEIDGASQVKEKFPDGVTVFILPPSIDELLNRIKSRGKDDEEAVKKRIARADSELKQAAHYDYAVLNEQLLIAVETLYSIIIAEKSKAKRNIQLIEEIRNTK